MQRAEISPKSPGDDVGAPRFASLRRIARPWLAAAAVVVAHLPAQAGNVVEYAYDAAGNITQVRRQSTAGLVITGVSPGSGAVGAAVTIFGSGFSATPADNAVRFSGVAATVTASDSGSIGTTVPAGAATGRITVTVGTSTATSPQDFVVVIPGAPTLASFSPASGAAGTSVAVTGTNFDPAAGATTVKLNGVVATSSVADGTSLSFVVPGATASGRITATTAAGTGASPTDFIVPPPGVSAADIASTVRLPPDGTAASLVVSAASKYGVLLFDGAANTYYTVQFSQLATSPTNAAIAYQVVKPDNTVLASGSIGGSNRPTLHLPRLPATGTYSVVLSVGIATLNTYARVAPDPVASADGPGVASSLDFANQSARFVFDAQASQRIGVGAAGLTLNPAGAGNVSFTVYQPDGTSLYAPSAPYCGGPTTLNPEGNCDGEITTAVAGTHTLVATSPASGLTNFTLQLSNEVAGTLSADVPQDVTLARVGQDARYAFAGAAGDSVGIDLSAANPLPRAQNVAVNVLKPDGTSLTGCTLGPPAGAYCELGALAAAGSYAVTVDPAYGAYGTFKLTAKQGSALATTDAPSSFATASLSESARFRFAGTAGQNLTVGVTNFAYVGSSASSTYLYVYRPDRTALGSVACSPTTWGATCKLTLANLPLTGTYSAVLVPPAGVKLAGNLNLSADLAGALTPGAPVALVASRAGQNARYTFSGTAGESTSIKFFAVSTVPAGQSVSVAVYKPDGGYLASGTASSSAFPFLNLGSLPATGTYTVTVQPYYGATWQGQLSLDPGAVLAVDGATASPATSAAGEPLRYRFSGTAGQRLDLGFAGLAYGAPSGSGTGLAVYRPDGTAIGSASCYTSGAASCELGFASLPSTGTYSIAIAPPVASAIVGGTLALSTPVAGAFVVGDPAQTIAITRPGQTARYGFAGTAGQLLRLNWVGATVSGTASVAVSVLKPDGSSLGTGSFVNGATGGMDIAALPTTGTYTVVFDPANAATMTAPTSLVTR